MAKKKNNKNNSKKVLWTIVTVIIFIAAVLWYFGGKPVVEIGAEGVTLVQTEEPERLLFVAKARPVYPQSGRAAADRFQLIRAHLKDALELLHCRSPPP